MYYYLIVALQFFCIYHLYKNKNDYFWFFVILFIPVIGSIIYLITQVYNKRDAETIQNEIATIINPSKKVKDLSAKVDFSDTYQNRSNLADAYIEIGDFNNALINYEKALKDTSGNDFYSIEKIIECYFELGAYDKVPNYAIKIKEHRDFKKSRVQFLYGMSLYNDGQFEEAERELLQINVAYSNYEERLSLSKLLNERGKSSEAKNILHEISDEAKHMIKSNRKKYRSTINEVERLLKERDA
jgi:hypothetical protein